jgi:hypothetical protein
MNDVVEVPAADKDLFLAITTGGATARRPMFQEVEEESDQETKVREASRPNVKPANVEK